MRASIAGLCALGLALSAGCGAATNQGAAGSRGTIAVSLLTPANPFFPIIAEHIKSEGAKHGYDTLVVYADEDPARQANQVKDFIVRKAAAIVLSPCESRAIVPALEQANAAGIPVFTVDIPCHEKGVKIACQIATDNVGGGREAARAMIEALGAAGGKVAILDYERAESCRLRVQGFREVIDKHNADGRGKIEIVSRLDGGGNKEQGYKAAEDVLQAHPDLRGIFAINDPSALGARSALEKAKKTEQVTLIGFDGMPEGKQAIKEGRIYADPIQFPDRLGDEVVKAIVEYYRGEELPPEVLLPTKLYRKKDAETDPDLK